MKKVLFASVSTAVLAANDILPTGMKITPTAASGSVFQTLSWPNPDSTKPGIEADHAVDIALSPDGKTLLILTSGYNSYNDSNGITDPALSKEHVFVYDISSGTPNKTQVIPVDNTFNGIAWNPKLDAAGKPVEFYVSGGVNDNIHVYTPSATPGQWQEANSRSRL